MPIKIRAYLDAGDYDEMTFFDWKSFIIDRCTVENVELVFPIELKDDVKFKMESEGWRITQIGPLMLNLHEKEPHRKIEFDNTRCKIKAFKTITDMADQEDKWWIKRGLP